MTSRIAAWLPIALLLAIPLEASKQESEAREFGTVWIWSDGFSFEEAVAIKTGEIDEAGVVAETKVYLESPKSNRAEMTYRYNPETAGFGLNFRDSISGWKAELEIGFIFDDESTLPISKERWDELIPLFNNPEVEGIAFARMNLSNGIEVTAEHATSAKLPPDQDVAALLRDSLAEWMAGLSPDEFRESWDFPESSLEMLKFLEIPQAESLREEVGLELLEALVATSLHAYSELESRRTALLDDASPARASFPGSEYQQRDWKVAVGSLGSEEADRAGARTTIDLIRKELAAYE